MIPDSNLLIPEDGEISDEENNVKENFYLFIFIYKSEGKRQRTRDSTKGMSTDIIKINASKAITQL